MNNTQKDNGKWDRYSGGVWSRLQERTRTTQAEYERGGHSETALHRLADELREVFGGVKVASALIPQIMAEHKKAVEWGLERLLVSARRLEALPYVEADERQGIEQRIRGIIALVDRGNWTQRKRRCARSKAGWSSYSAPVWRPSWRLCSPASARCTRPPSSSKEAGRAENARPGIPEERRIEEAKSMSKVPRWLKQRQRDLRKRIAQSMRDAGGATGRCRKLQKKLNRVERVRRVLRGL